MNCCKNKRDDRCDHDCDRDNNSCGLNSCFIILIIFILLAIVLGGVIF